MFWAGQRGFFQNPFPGMSPSYNQAQDMPAYQLARASSLGVPEAELYRSYTQPSYDGSDPFLEASAAAGTTYHAIEEQRMVASGRADAAEQFVYDPIHGVAGHIDIMESGMPADVKTVSRGIFQRLSRTGRPASKNVAQLQFYMHMTGAPAGKLHYIMREDPSQRITMTVPYSRQIMEQNFAKVQRVRERVGREVQAGFWRMENLPMTASPETLMEYEASGGEPQHSQAYLQYAYKQQMRYLNDVRLATQALKGFSSPGHDEAYNTIQGLSETGLAANLRRTFTDFGSPWQGVSNWVRGVLNKIASGTRSAFRTMRHPVAYTKKYLFARRLNQGARQYKSLLSDLMRQNNVEFESITSTAFTPSGQAGAIEVLAKNKAGEILFEASRFFEPKAIDLSVIEVTKQLRGRGLGRVFQESEIGLFHRMGYRTGTKVTSPVVSPITARFQLQLYGGRLVPNGAWAGTPEELAQATLAKEIQVGQFPGATAEGRLPSNLGINRINGFQEQGLSAKIRKLFGFGSPWTGVKTFLGAVFGRKAALTIVRHGSAESVMSATLQGFKRIGGKIQIGDRFHSVVSTSGPKPLSVFVPEADLMMFRKELGVATSGDLIGSLARALRKNPGALANMSQQSINTATSLMHEMMEVHSRIRGVVGASNLRRLYRAGPEKLMSEYRFMRGHIDTPSKFGTHASEMPIETELAFSGRISDAAYKYNVQFRKAEQLYLHHHVTGPYSEVRRTYMDRMPQILQEYDKLAKAGALKRQVVRRIKQVISAKQVVGLAHRANHQRIGHGVGFNDR